MAIAITGSKYASAAVNAVGTTTVTVGTTPFVQTDFNVSRLAALFSSGALKGIAWVRRWVSTSQLELQTQFFDPATGNTVTQAVGDVVLVSKNFSESTTTGLSISGNVVTMSDSAVTFGTAGSESSLVFYDENYTISVSGTVVCAGGVTVLGKLDVYPSQTSSPCNVYFGNAASSLQGSLRATDAAAHFMMYGGVISGLSTSTIYIGGNAANAGGGTGGKTGIFVNVQNSFDFASPGAGGSFGANASRNQLINCTSISTATNAILRRWGDGIISGGTFKFPNNTSGPISVFGSDIAATVNVGAPAGQRAVVLDMGNGPALVRASAAINLTFNFTNLITTDFRSVTGSSGSLAANANGTNNMYFSDTYSNLQSGTVGIIAAQSDGSVSASSTGLNGSWSPSLLRRVYRGTTQNTLNGPWNFGFKAYGYAPVSGTITPTTYSLGSAGSADNVVFGGTINQAIDSNVTLSLAAANALASISNLSNFYDATIAWSVASVANAQYPSLGSYPISANGTQLSIGALNLTIDSTAGSAYAINTSTNTITIRSVPTVNKFTSLVTTGNVTLNTQAPTNGTYAPITGANITLAGATVYQSLTATTGISGFATSGTIIQGQSTTATSIGFGPSSSMTLTGNGTFARSTFSGTLNITTTGNYDITVTNCAGSLRPIVTGGGSVRFIIDGTTPRTTLPTTVTGGSVVYRGYLNLSGLLPGSTVFINDPTGAQQDYVASSGTTYTFAVTAPMAGTWTWTVRQYGQVVQSGTFDLSLGGTINATVAQYPDTAITDTLANVQAYTTLDTAAKLYDYFAYYTTLSGNNFPQPSRFATTIGAGSYNITVNTTATQPLSVTASSFTFKVASAFTGSISTSGLVTGKDLVSVQVNDSAGQTNKLRNTRGTAMGTSVTLVNGSGVATDLGYQVSASRSVTVPTGSTVRYCALEFGYKPVYVASASTDSDFLVTSTADPYISTTVDPTTLAAITAKMSLSVRTIAPYGSCLVLSVSGDLRAYTPTAVLAAMSSVFVSSGAIVAPFIIGAQAADIGTFFNGGFNVSVPGLFAQVDDSITTPSATGYLIPVQVTTSGAAAAANFSPLRLNSSNIPLQTAPWTQNSASVTPVDQQSIAAAVWQQTGAQKVNRGIQNASILVPYSETL